MRPPVTIEIDHDPARSRRKRVVLRSECGNVEVLASDLTATDAERLLVPLRKAFLSGVQWMRDDASSYVLSTIPNVHCVTQGAK